MAESCANCGRADLMQPQLDKLQCLACGALTDIATGQVVTPGEKPATVSNAGFPVTELSNNVTVAPANDFDRRERNEVPDPAPVEVEAVPEVVTPRPARVDASYVPAEAPVEPSETVLNTPAGETTIDLSHLTPEQFAEVQQIVSEDG